MEINTVSLQAIYFFCHVPLTEWSSSRNAEIAVSIVSAADDPVSNFIVPSIYKVRWNTYPGVFRACRSLHM